MGSGIDLRALVLGFRVEAQGLKGLGFDRVRGLGLRVLGGRGFRVLGFRALWELGLRV